ncbi:MAG: tRNA-dihydrouridine synthase, partial [Candidatus Acidiferrales bacterium]
VMIGRTASTNPWIFRQIDQYLASGTYEEPSESDRYRLLSDYFRSLAATDWPDAIGKMKQFACWFTHGVRNGAELRHHVHLSKNIPEILERVDSFFAAAV